MRGIRKMVIRYGRTCLLEQLSKSLNLYHLTGDPEHWQDVEYFESLLEKERVDYSRRRL